MFSCLAYMARQPNRGYAANMADLPLPASGTRVRCINNDTRSELKLGQVYTVVSFDTRKMPMNKDRFYPDDFRFIAIEMPGQKERGIFPFGIFEVIGV